MERDNSTGAIEIRYRAANIMAVASHNSIVFESLRDIPFLITERNNIIERGKEYGRVTLENELLKEEVARLKEELNATTHNTCHIREHG